MANEELFQWPDYLVLSIVLALSAAIGFYYAFTGGKQKTTKEYLFADKNMHWLPVSCSLLASYISSLTMVSTPGEIYSFGTVFMYIMVFTPIGILIASGLYLPVFEQIKLVSVYKYIERRFGKVVKILTALANVLNTLMYSGLVIYGPALSISAVSGMDIWVSILTVLLISTLYTVMGGMKAVLWTDTLQLLIMFAGLFTVLIAGSIKEGGAAEVYHVNKLSGRMDVFDTGKIFLIDPRIRHTFWNMAINSILAGVSLYGISQTSVMRAISLRPGHRQLSYASTAALSLIFKLLSCAMGLIIFAGFRYCDPIKDGVITSNDQYYPLYVMRTFGKYPGLPGFILSAVFSGSLSTLSSLLSALATIIMEDFIRPWKPTLSDRKTTIIVKVLAVMGGAVSISFSVFAMNYGKSIISMIITITGIFGGPSFGLFTMGIFMPFVNKKGALVGFFMGSVFGGLVGIGGLINRTYVYKYPITTAGCNVTDPLMLANISSPIYDPASWNPQAHFREGFDALFDVSYAWLRVGGILTTFLFGILASVIFNCFDKEPETVNHLLLSPHVAHSRFLPASWKARIDYSDDPTLTRTPVLDDDKDIDEDSTSSSMGVDNKAWIGLEEKTPDSLQEK